jgi:Na+/melibiose symporter-like transporter
MWLAMLASAAVLVGCGVFFALQDLGNAGQYAGVASFFLALLTAAGSLVSLARSKSREQAAKGSEGNQHRVARTTLVLAWRNKYFQHGDRPIMIINETAEPAIPEKESPDR